MISKTDFETNGTPWAVDCPAHGKVYLSKEDYHAQLLQPDQLWKCPKCFLVSEFDDENWEKWLGEQDDIYEE